MKGQSFIIEFVLFFLISFSIFSVISYNFFSQNKYFKKNIGNKTAGLVNNLISTHIIRSSSCKNCEDIYISEDIPSRIGESFYIIQLNDNELNTTIITSSPFSRLTSIFSMNESFDFLNSITKSDNKKVEIKINNRDKNIEVG